ncbi:MAG: twin-arginine translocase subunit TatC [Nannocystaceae bacterium]|nr:twin-arginine translocase subunit TatC [Nannocystaceae bacterium]
MADAKQPAPAPANNGADGLAEGPEGDTPMSFFDHLAELRRRISRAFLALVLSAIVAYVFVDYITAFMWAPFGEAWRSAGLEGEPTLLNLTALDVILTDIWIALFAGVFVSAPVIFYQLWMFIAPGLYAQEKRLVVPFVATSAIMFVAGAAFCYYVVLPIATEFFLTYAQKKTAVGSVEVHTAYTYADYASYVMKVLFGFGLMFEMPLAVFFLSKAGIITYLSLLRHWKVAVLLITIASAVLTPPDPITIWLMGIPMTALYFISVAVSYVVSKPQVEAMRRLEAELAQRGDDGDDDE